LVKSKWFSPIKKFPIENNTGDDLLLDFKTLANNCLAYLIDDGFQFDIYRAENHLSVQSGTFKFSLSKLVGGKYVYYKWQDIKDDFIPFVQLVKEKFIISNAYLIRYKERDDVSDTDKRKRLYNSEIESIDFVIKGYKES